MPSVAVNMMTIVMMMMMNAVLTNLDTIHNTCCAEYTKYLSGWVSSYVIPLLQGLQHLSA